MGRLLLALARTDPELRVAGAIEAPGHPTVGHDAGEVAGGAPLGVRVEEALAAVCRPEHVVIDFTGAPAAAVAHAVLAANFSVGIAVLTELATLAARLLDASWEAEIVELHHHGKRDAPSGTALALGRAVAAARGLDFARAAVLAREGQVGARRPEEIGIVGLRAGDAVGDHTVLFGGLGERLELVHRMQDRGCLARGALRAARWVATRPAGLHDLRDVLGLGT